MQAFGLVDWIAVGVFGIGWLGYSWLVDSSPWRARTLSARVERQRRRWMEMMLRRDIRMVDTSIVAGLQNGTAFFASTSLLAIGAAFALLTSRDQVLTVVQDLRLDAAVSRAAWEAKALGLLAIYGYAFFKFGWSYRLFNYTSILIGATPPPEERDGDEARQAVRRAAELGIVAGQHFSRGLRAFFFSVGFLGWFASPWLFLALTLIVLVVLYRRQFASSAGRVLD